MDLRKLIWSDVRKSGISGTTTCSTLSSTKDGPDQSIPYSAASA